MDAFAVEGGARLAGKIPVHGSKNATLPILAACLMAEGPCELRGIPLLRDVQTQVKILNTLGLETSWRGRTITTRQLDHYNNTAPYELVKQMRAGVCVLGPLVAKRGRARVSLPGGCVIGKRPIDLHLRGLEALGAEIAIEHGYIEAKAPPGGLRGAEVYLGGTYGSSVTATENVLSAAALARGTTVIECAACEPEVVDLAGFLCAMGARIEGAGSPRITVRGVKRLRGTRWRVMPDRIEAATFVILAAITGSELTISGARGDHMLAFLDVMRQMGIGVERTPRSLRVLSCPRPRACELVTMPYPAFPTDCQAQVMALAALGEGTSVITERIYPERFMAAAEMSRMGADIDVADGRAVIQGVDHLDGAEVMASDLRASAALVIAAAAARGETWIHRVYHIDRGYERIEERLARIGLRIRRVAE